MAFDDKSVNIADYGAIYWAEVGTAMPTNGIKAFNIDDDTVTVGSGETQKTWNNFGHTSANNMVEVNLDFGSAEAKRTWQRKNFRNAYGESSGSISAKLLQMNKETLQLVFNATFKDGMLGAKLGSDPKRLALVVVFQETAADNDESRRGLYLPKVAIRPDGGPQLSTDDFVEQGFTGDIEDPGADGFPFYLLGPWTD